MQLNKLFFLFFRWEDIFEVFLSASPYIEATGLTCALLELEDVPDTDLIISFLIPRSNQECLYQPSRSATLVARWLTECRDVVLLKAMLDKGARDLL